MSGPEPSGSADTFMRQRWSPHWYLIAACLALAGTALKVQQWYFSRPLWLDEEMVLLNVRDRSFGELTGALWLSQAAPIGWLWLQRAAVLAFGTDDRVVRALPVLAGIATLWTAWWMARRAFTPWAGAIFIALCAVSQWMTFYALEVKPYSSDAFAAILLLAVAIWAADEETQPFSLRRTALWWATAAMAQWFSFGATLVMPACALVLIAAAWRHAGTRSAVLVACQGAVWLVCFGVHYVLSLRGASSDPFLRDFWASGFAPADGGIAAIAGWIASQAEPLASHPGGTQHWLLFWLTAVGGAIVLMLRRPASGALLLLMPLSGVLFAIAHVVPMKDRLALWMFPAIYAGVAVAAGYAIERAFELRSWRGMPVLALSLVLSVSALVVGYDIVTRGNENIIIRGNNHGFDDARSVRLLARLRQPGDAWLATHFSLPAVWWYAEVPVADPERGSRMPGDPGGSLFEITHKYFGTPECRKGEPLRDLQETLSGVSRVVVYLGFDSKIPDGFQELVLDRLSHLGARVAYRAYGEGITAIYDLRQPPDIPAGREVTPVALSNDLVKTLDGCVGISLARRW